MASFKPTQPHGEREQTIDVINYAGLNKLLLFLQLQLQFDNKNYKETPSATP